MYYDISYSGLEGIVKLKIVFFKASTIFPIANQSFWCKKAIELSTYFNIFIYEECLPHVCYICSRVFDVLSLMVAQTFIIYLL